MRNFDIIKDNPALVTLYEYCSKAEQFQLQAAEVSASYARKALEWMLSIIYHVNDYEKPSTPSLFNMMNAQPFKDFMGPMGGELLDHLHAVRKIGNNASHPGHTITTGQSLFALVTIHTFVCSVLNQMGILEEIPKFDKSLIPGARQSTMIPVQPTTEEPPVVVPPSINKPIKPLTTASVDKVTISEEETRRIFIDMLLQEAGWQVLSTKGAVAPLKACIEVEVHGMPSESKIGYADYVLFGANGNPLAVIEAKRTSVDKIKGRHQAELYADCLEKRYGIRPVVYLSNGYTTSIIDGIYPERELMSFHTADELTRIIDRRSRKNILDFKVNDEIANRYYQKEAIKSVCEHLNGKNRHALLVMATGTGKTRTAISLVDVLARNRWVKNVLFLADRTALVSQAKKNFAKLLPSMTYCVLSENGDNKDKDLNARIMFCTYQTMINYIDDKDKKFGIGRFDLIIIDEAHRSVFGKFGSIFKYFDSLLVGLTATPRQEVDRSTYELFNLEEGEPNYAYELSQAVMDGYLNDFKVVNRTTKMLNRGIKYDDLSPEEKKELERVWEYENTIAAMNGQTPQGPRDIENNEIFKYIFNTDTIDKVLKDLMTNGLKVLDGERIGKTIIFAFNHQHAELIVKRFGVLYPQYGADFCQLIDNYVKYAHDLIEKFEQREQMPQIAVSVDMLDVGIDIPDILNLVFFKVVRSKIKFWQMVGRGTRLAEGVFGPGKNKEFFYIFDWCGNCEYFSTGNITDVTTNSSSITERLFGLKADIACALQNVKYQSDTEEKALHDRLKSELLTGVQELTDSRIDVREHWKMVTKYRTKEAWLNISEVDVLDIKNEIAPLIISAEGDVYARKFDVLMLKIELSLLDDTQSAERAQVCVVQIAQALTKKGNLPQVMAKIDTINEVLTPAYWENLSLSSLERVRIELRELLKFLKDDNGRTFEVNIEDEIEDAGEVKMTFTPLTYKQKVVDYLAQHGDHPVLQKIKHVKQLTNEDIRELEKILWNELGTKEDYDKTAHDMSVGAFIRRMIGVDRKVAMDLFSTFISGATLNSQQEEYLRTIITYVCQNGDIEKDDLINEAPFDSFDWTVFQENLSKIVDYVNEMHRVIYA